MSNTNIITNYLEHLIRFPTLPDDHATCRAALDWVEDQLSNLPLHITRLEHGGSPSLIATTQRTRSPRLWLAAHIDVVPGPAHIFEPTITDHRLVARGAYDMKFALATFMALLQDLAPQLPHYDLGLMITSDEELGGADGVAWLVDQGYRGQAVLLPDGGANWEDETAAKGVSHWRLTAHGHSAHGSRPWDGANAIDRLVQFTNELRSHAPAEPCGDPQHAHTTFNLGRLTGGSAANQVADQAEALVDIRFTPDTTPAEIRSWVQDAQLHHPHIQAAQLVEAPAYRLPPTPAHTLYRDIAANVLGRPLSNVMAHGASDARFFAAHRIPVITVRPRGGDQHSNTEWLDLRDLEPFYAITRQFTDTWAKLPATK